MTEDLMLCDFDRPLRGRRVLRLDRATPPTPAELTEVYGLHNLVSIQASNYSIPWRGPDLCDIVVAYPDVQNFTSVIIFDGVRMTLAGDIVSAERVTSGKWRLHVAIAHYMMHRWSLGPGVVTRRTGGTDTAGLPDHPEQSFSPAVPVVSVMGTRRPNWLLFEVKQIKSLYKASGLEDYTGFRYCAVRISNDNPDYLPGDWANHITARHDNRTINIATAGDVIVAAFAYIDTATPAAEWGASIGEVSGMPLYATESHALARSIGFFLTTAGGSPIDITPSAVRRYALADAAGNVVLNLPHGRTVKALIGRYDWGISGILCRVWCTSDRNWFEPANPRKDVHLEEYPSEGLTVTFPCATLPVIVDSFVEYTARQRQYDKEMMHIQADQAALTSLTGAGSGVVGGAISGAMVGGPVGAAAGALVGGVGALSSVGLNYLAADYINGRIQDAKDDAMALSSDTVGVTADSYMTAAAGDILKILSITGDSTSTARTEQDLTYNGVYVSEFREDVDALIGTDEAPLQADCEVLGTMPSNARAAIHDMIMSGVRIRKVE